MLPPGASKPPELVSLFATPMVRWRLADAAVLNAALSHAVLEREARGAEARVSNFGGWQSHHDFLDGPEAPVVTLRGHIQTLLRFVLAIPAGGDLSRVEGRLDLRGWANVNRDGHFNRIHNHAENHFSGVYYVSLGTPEPGIRHNGAIEFLDPRPAASAAPVPAFNLGTPLTIMPEPGEFILFPSWLQHGVLPFRGKGERISIAFNARVGGYRIK